MRKLKLQVQITVDGYVGGPKGELNWMTWNMDAKLAEYINFLTDTSDTILMGRKMTDEFVKYWTNAAADPKNPEYIFALKMVGTPKVVFTKTLDSSNWDNTTLAKGQLCDEVMNLKKQKGKDIIVYGGAGFVSSLVKENLIDDYHLFIHPVGIGKGLTIFNSLDKHQPLELVSSQSYDCGVVVLHYQLRK